MNELLKKDFTMKAISVLIAIILWFMVLDQSNPYETKPINIPLTIQNRDALKAKNIILKNESTFPQTVEIKFNGRHDKLSNISENDWEAVLDLSKITNADMTTLIIDGPSYKGKDKDSIKDFTYTMEPRTVNLELEAVGKNVFHVDTKTGGNLKDKYSILNIATTPDSLQLVGNDSLLQTVGSIKAIVNVTNLDKDMEIKQMCTVFDKDNKDITKLFKNLTAVNVKITVAKEVAVKPVISGIPAPNFLNVSNISSPQKVLITGPHDIISQIDSLETIPISIENQNQNAIISSELVLPDGVSVVNAPSEVTVSLAIEPLAKKAFILSSGDIAVINPEIDNSLNYNILSENLAIEIKGPKYELDKLDLKSIAPSIDVNKLVEGDYKVPLQLTLPDTVRLSQDYEVDLSITKR